MPKQKQTKKHKRKTGSAHKHEKLQRYSSKDFKSAMKELRDPNNVFSIRTIGRKYNIPHATLAHRLTKRAHLGTKTKTLGGPREPKVLNKGKHIYLFLSS
jgi:hypothetical protein